MDTRPYIVKLECESGSIGPSEQIAAEVRFISALERVFGDPQGVATAYKAWAAVVEAQADELDLATAALAHRWAVAYQVAAVNGLDGIHGVEHPTFAIRLP